MRITGYTIRQRLWCLTDRQLPFELKVYHIVPVSTSIDIMYPNVFPKTDAIVTTKFRFQDMNRAISALNKIHNAEYNRRFAI